MRMTRRRVSQVLDEDVGVGLGLPAAGLCRERKRRHARVVGRSRSGQHRVHDEFNRPARRGFGHDDGLRRCGGNDDQIQRGRQNQRPPGCPHARLLVDVTARAKRTSLHVTPDARPSGSHPALQCRREAVPMQPTRMEGPMRHLFAGVLVALSLASLGAQDRGPAPWPAETAAQKEARLAWWTDARFGMFIHWGLYALPARHEWVKKSREDDRRGLSEVLRPVQSRPLRSEGMGPAGQAGRHEVRRHHVEAPRGLLPLRLEVHGLQGDQHARRSATSSSPGSRRSAPKV